MRVLLISLACSFWTVHLLPAATIEYLISDAIIANPERGFYVQHTAQFEDGEAAPAPLSASELQDHYAQQMSLILRLYAFNDSRTTSLTSAHLALIAEDCAVLRSVGLKAIIRFCYTRSFDDPDAPLATVLQHIEQLAPVLAENLDVIATVQAGFIGPWGEWHSSSNGLGTTQNMRTILERLLNAVPQERAVGVRTPRYKQAIFDRTGALSAREAFTGTDISRTGHHNDCFLANDSDWGTYLNPPVEKAYLNRETRYVPMGGETCNPDIPRSLCPTAVAEMEQLHWSYLNSTYHRSVLSGWTDGGCMDDIRRRLGYRLRLVRTTVPQSVRPGDVLPVQVELANDGFAAPYNPRLVELVLRHSQSGAVYDVTLPEEPRSWLPSSTTPHVAHHHVLLPQDLPEGDYGLFLSLPDPVPSVYGHPRFSIQLANPGGWEADTGYNDLLVQLTVSSNAPVSDPGTSPVLVLVPTDTAPTPVTYADPFPTTDTDGDGLPDLWEIAHFGGATDALPSDDADGDGQTNQEEFVAQTDPRDPGSRFVITGMDMADALGIHYQSVSGRIYALQGLSALGADAPDWQDLTTHQVGTGSPQQFTDAAGNAACSYRVQVSLP